MDEHVFIIVTKVHKILESKEPISDELRPYLTGLLEGVLEAYKDKEVQIPVRKRTIFDKLGIKE